MCHKNVFLSICMMGLLAAGCHADTCSDAPKTPSIPSFSTTQSALKSIKLAGDLPASQAFENIQKRLASGEPFRMNIYSLSAEQTIDKMAQNRLGSANTKDIQNMVIASNDALECAWGRNSLYEECYRKELIQQFTPVSREDIYPDEYYIQEATKVLNVEMNAQSTAHYKFMPYKRKYGIQATAPSHDFTQITESVYEVAIGFSSELDGWPVIGPGGKAYVHMTPEGNVTTQKIYRKIPQNVIAKLTEKDIKTPDEALQEVVKKENIKLDDHHMVRHEFGYFYWGKNSIQNIIAPHYVFFFEPANGHYKTRTYYIVSAVKGEYAKLVNDDYQLEVMRKMNQIKNIKPEEEK